MPKIRYSAKENKRVGTHSYYAQAIPTGKLSFRELCEEACEDNTYSIEEMTGCVSRFMKTIQREALRGWRCQLGEDFLTIFPQIDASVKDYTDPETGQLVVATAEMLTANNAHSRLGCSVHKKFSAKFATSMNTLEPYIRPQTSVERLKGDLELPEEMIINGVLYRRVRESED